MLLPVILGGQISTGIEDFKWKSLILAEERGAIEEGISYCYSSFIPPFGWVHEDTPNQVSRRFYSILNGRVITSKNKERPRENAKM
jgi:hypothetical protein